MKKRHLCSVITLLALGSASFAFGPEDAYKYQDPRIPPLKAQVDAAAQSLQNAQTGLGGSLTLKSGYTIPGPGNTSDTPGFGLGGTKAELSWGPDPVTIGRALRDLERSRRDYYRTVVGSTEGALIAHARLLRFQNEVAQREARLKASQANLAELQKKPDTSADQLERARGDLSFRQLDLQRFQLELQQARDAAASFGLSGDAEPRTLRFAIPQVRVEDTPAYKLALAELQLARAEAQRENLAYLNRLSLGVTYTGSQVETGLTVGFARGIPSVGASAELKTSSGTKISIGLEANIPLEAFLGGSAQSAQANVRLRELDLESTRQSLAAQLRAAQASIALAEQGLASAETSLASETRFLQQSEADFKAGKISEQEYLSRLGDARAMADYARAWEDYIRSVGDYLELVGGTWQTR